MTDTETVKLFTETTIDTETVKLFTGLCTCIDYHDLRCLSAPLL